MRYENTASMREELAYVMTRAPRFNPERGETQEVVFKKLRDYYEGMKKEWWGGDALYQKMSAYINDAETQLNAGNEFEALRAFGEIYAIIGQTPKPKKIKSEKI